MQLSAHVGRESGEKGCNDMTAILKYGTIIVGLFVSMVLGFGLALGSCSAELMPKALAADTQSQVEAVKSSSDDILSEIQANVDLVADLKAKVQQAQLSGQSLSLDQVIADVQKVSDSYASLAARRDEIKKALLARVSKVESMKSSVDSEVKALQSRRADYLDQKRVVADPDPEIASTRKEALTKAISYVDEQITLWQQFGQIQGDIVIDMGEIQTKIDRFLAMIEDTSLVFKEGLAVLKLQRDINQAVTLFSSDIPQLEQLTSDMRASWDNLDALLGMLTGVANIAK